MHACTHTHIHIHINIHIQVLDTWFYSNGTHFRRDNLYYIVTDNRVFTENILNFWIDLSLYELIVSIVIFIEGYSSPSSSLRWHWKHYQLRRPRRRLGIFGERMGFLGLLAQYLSIYRRTKLDREVSHVLGVPIVIIRVCLGFSLLNRPTYWVARFMETIWKISHGLDQLELPADRWRQRIQQEKRQG